MEINSRYVYVYLNNYFLDPFHYVYTLLTVHLFPESLELVYMKEENGAVFQVIPFHDKLLASVNSEVGSPVVL